MQVQIVQIHLSIQSTQNKVTTASANGTHAPIYLFSLSLQLQALVVHILESICQHKIQLEL